MKRIIYMVFMNLFHAPVWLLKIARMARPGDNHTMQQRYDYIAEMTRRIIKRGRVTIKVTGVEHIPEKDGFMLFPNHQGLFDVLALFSTCPKALSVVIKKEASGWILVTPVECLAVSIISLNVSFLIQYFINTAISLTVL